MADAPGLAQDDPLLTQATSEPSPQEERVVERERDRGVLKRLAEAEAAGPSVRQRTQSEVIDLTLFERRYGNPFSIRWIPFEQLREMTTDLMLAFGWWMMVTQLARAEWSVQCEDAQLAAAVDAALRPVVVQSIVSFTNALWFGHSPGVKRFRLGRLDATYRDPNGKDPDKDLPVWASSADALLWHPPAALNPSHCLPTWDDDGQLIGFKFSNTPIPHADLIAAANAYGYEVIPGKDIGPDFALWITSESSQNFGSLFGSARTKRAYPYWWSYWYRWRLADRAYENLAIPAKLVYYPIDFEQYIDPEDAGSDNPLVRRARDTALSIGEQTRAGATIALPGTLADASDGRGTQMRKWEINYLNPQTHFTELDATFRLLDTLKLRAWFLPEQAYVEGSGSRTAGGSSGGTGGARMATQLGQIAEESGQVLASEYDDVFNLHFIPQFVAANYPEKIGTPCRKVTRSLGVLDDETQRQVLQLIGQVRGEVIPVNVRALLERMGIPVLNERQMRAEVQNISKLAALMGPPEQAPEKVGTQGYNAGVMKTEKGNFYYQPPQRFDLAESDGFMNSLPDTPHFRDAGVRSALVRLRRLLLDRYREQYASLADFVAAQPSLNLADDAGPGVDEKRAHATAASIVGLWAASHAPGLPGAAQVAVASATEPDSIASRMAALMTKIALAGGRDALKGARLSADGFDAEALAPWVAERVQFALESIDHTVRDEATEWLADEIEQSTDPTSVASAAREHFENFPASHADRAARTETCEAFNRGTLDALDLAGVAQVQVHDASDGTDTTTDSVCQQRNGRVVSIEEARGIDLAHPRCTLAFSPLTTESLSVERVDELPSRLAQEGRTFAYEEGTETLYVLDALSDEQERGLLLVLGDQLTMR